MTRSSDLVMVERAVLERARNRIHTLGVVHADPRHYIANEKIYLPELEAALQSVEGGVQGSIATKQATDETAASVLSDPPEEWVICAGCYGEGSINKTIHVYEAGCGFSHPDVEAVICPECNGSGGIISEIGPVCEICGGDCASANPPMIFCPMRDLSSEDRS